MLLFFQLYNHQNILKMQKGTAFKKLKIHEMSMFPIKSNRYFNGLLEYLKTYHTVYIPMYVYDVVD